MILGERSLGGSNGSCQTRHSNEVPAMAKHLTMEERKQIAELHARLQSQATIAKALGRHCSTICRKMGRNRERFAYCPFLAHQKAEERRRQRPLTPKIKRPEIAEQVRQGLPQYHSPDQIAGRMKRNNPLLRTRVSRQTIYNWIRNRPPEEGWHPWSAKNEGKPCIGVGFSAVFSERQQTTLLCPSRSSEILSRKRFVMHVFRAEKPTVLWESRSIGSRLLKWLKKPRIKRTFSQSRRVLHDGCRSSSLRTDRNTCAYTACVDFCTLRIHSNQLRVSRRHYRLTWQIQHLVGLDRIE